MPLPMRTLNATVVPSNFMINLCYDIISLSDSASGEMVACKTEFNIIQKACSRVGLSQLLPAIKVMSHDIWKKKKK